MAFWQLDAYICEICYLYTKCFRDIITLFVSYIPFIFPEGVIAGGTAGVVVETVLYPIDTIKTRLQAGQS